MRKLTQKSVTVLKFGTQIFEWIKAIISTFLKLIIFSLPEGVIPIRVGMPNLRNSTASIMIMSYVVENKM